MSLRFQADADLHPEVVKGLRRREPAIDFQLATTVFPPGTPDAKVLEIAAEQGRVLVSCDVNTMPSHFAHLISKRDSPGLILIPSRHSIGSIIEALLSLWAECSPDEFRNRIEWLS